MAQGLRHSATYSAPLEVQRLRCIAAFIEILNASVVSHLLDVYSEAKSKLRIFEENYSAANSK
jgi:hypothetical protein